jgi:3-oxoacyl-[acyl-carrier protein] reductase
MPKQKTILITGSSRGIGKAIAKLAHQEGYKVIVHGKTDSKELQQTHKELKGSIKVFFDVSDKKETQQALSQIIKNVGTIDVLVNNAGIALNYLKDVGEMDDENALKEYRTNVLGTLHCVQAILPQMLKRKSGSVINIASFKGIYNMTTMSTLTYGATKAGVIAITKALAKSYSEKGVRFNVVLPGYVRTDMSDSWSEDAWKRINSGILLGKIAEPEQIAEVVIFLASDKSSYMTGSEILVDGGYTIKGK